MLTSRDGKHCTEYGKAIETVNSMWDYLAANSASGWSGWSGATGPSGVSGPSGPRGPQGDSGFSGWSGISGYSGYSGYSGWSGMVGANGAIPPVIASDNLRNSHDAEKLFTWLTTYQKQKTITFTNGLGVGTFRVYFELGNQGSNAATKSYGRIYKNGVAIGTERTRIGLAYVGYTEDFSGPLNPGDTIELWCYQNGGTGDGGKCRNFRVSYDLASGPMTTDATNSTPNLQVYQNVSVSRPAITAYATASDTLQWAKDSYTESYSDVYVTFKSFRSGIYLSSFKVKATLKTNSYTGYAQVFKNGTAIGAEIPFNNTYTLKDLGTFYGIVPGDLIELKYRRGTGSWCYATTAGIYFTVGTMTTEFV